MRCVLNHVGALKGVLPIYSWIDNLLQNGNAIAPETLAGGLAARILRAAVEEGGSRREIISAVGLDEARLRNPLSRMSGPVALRLFKFLQTHFNDPAFHLRLGQKAGAQSFSDFGYGARLEADLGAVIRARVQVQALRQNMVRTAFYSDGKPPYFEWECAPDLCQDYASIVEFLVVSFAHLSRQVLDEAPLLPSMHFRHQPQFDTAIYEATFGCPVRFGMPQTRMEMLGRQVFRLSPFANQPLFDAAFQNYEEPSKWALSGKTHLAVSYFYLASELDKSPPTLERMVASFGMTARTLRRKLVEEGMSFRDLLDRVRQDNCKLYFMEDTRPLGEIALLLGYSDLSAFTRAHKNWTGFPPSKR